MVGAFRSKWASLAVLGLVSSPLLVGCGGGDTVQEALGYEQEGPDELAVIKRPPLIVPPDYNLRPPRADDRSTGSNAASDAARETLIGPSSSTGGEPSEARAILTGTAPESGAGEEKSEGQNLLVSRTDRAERNLDELTETRGENRIDRALLRRLLAWTPEDRKAPAGGDEAGGDEAEADPGPDGAAAIVQVVSRSQTVIGTEPDPNSANTE